MLESLFNKVAGLKAKFCEIFKNTFFYRTPPVAASIFQGHSQEHPQLWSLQTSRMWTLQQTVNFSILDICDSPVYVFEVAAHLGIDIKVLTE